MIHKGYYKMKQQWLQQFEQLCQQHTTRITNTTTTTEKKITANNKEKTKKETSFGDLSFCTNNGELDFIFAVVDVHVGSVDRDASRPVEAAACPVPVRPATTTKNRYQASYHTKDPLEKALSRCGCGGSGVGVVGVAEAGPHNHVDTVCCE